MSRTQKRKFYPGTFELFAIIVKGGKKVSCGQNHGERSSKLIERNKTHQHCLIHAEVDAVLEGRKINCDLTGSTIYVARVYRKDGNSPAMARPCEMCRKVLFKHGIKKCYYTIDEKHYGKLMIYNSHNDCRDTIYAIGE
jgi:deoxycytidylate deaminase